MIRYAAAVVVALAMVATVPPPNAAATFPGSNGEIALNRWTKGQTDIWTVDRVTGQTSRLTRSRNFNEVTPDWSADGTRIAFSRCAVAEPTQCELWVMNVDSGDKRQLTFTDKMEEGSPTWAPDGTEIAYTLRNKDSQSIWVITADGRSKRRLTKKRFDSFPEWSPDGSRIAYSSRHKLIEDIWLVDVDGSDATQLTFGRRDAEHPDWSPDGESILFSRGGDIWAAEVEDDDRAERITRTNRRWEFAPTYSPDGSEVAYTALMRNGEIAIWVMAADGSDRTRLTRASRDFFPDWRAD